MRSAVRIPVTVKTRIGIDDRDDYGFLREFIDEVAAAGCDVFIIHARKAILQGLSPKENREIPPLVYERAWQVKRDCPQLTVIVNGGLRTVPQVAEQWPQVDGVMLGREAYHNPYVLSALHRAAWDDGFHAPEPWEIVERMQEYAAEQVARGVPLRAITRHMLGMMSGRAGARNWRRTLSEGVNRGSNSPGLMAEALRAAEG
jgi:tRNA-dihydrouridine synthase A